jgi:hypothetical protein
VSEFAFNEGTYPNTCVDDDHLPSIFGNCLSGRDSCGPVLADFRGEAISLGPEPFELLGFYSRRPHWNDLGEDFAAKGEINRFMILANPARDLTGMVTELPDSHPCHR